MFFQINSTKPKSKIFEINSKNFDVGENKTRLQASLSGEDVEVSLNSRYFIDCAQSIGADSFILKLNGGKPLTINGVSDHSFLYLVMPMNR